MRHWRGRWRRRGRWGRSRRHRRGPPRLFWRVYVYGILLLTVVSVSVGAANYVLGTFPRNPFTQFRELAGFVDTELSPLLEQPAALDAKIEHVHRAFGINVAVYGAGGVLLADAGTRPDALPSPPHAPRWLHGGVALPLAGGAAYVVAQWPSDPLRWLFVPFIVLFVLALVTIPLARNLVRPIEQITRAARAVGEGKLDARTGVTRRDEVGALAAAFDDMAARLERLVAGEKELRANVSHELRTPLARIRVALELAEEGSDNPATTEKHLRGIRGDIIELEELVDQVLITARLDLASDEDLALRRSAIDLAELAESSATRFSELHPSHRLEVDVADETMMVTADPKLIKRVIDNLLDNSAKYANPADGPTTLAIRGSARGTSITVSDRGEGVAADEIDRLFEPFFRADSMRTQNKKGVGLGLSFCRRVVEAHGGTITAKRRPEGGLTVTFTLPS